MKTRRFTAEDQVAFAQLSGDFNPLHMDALAARRLLYGAPVVHGIHGLLWALDSWLENQAAPIEIRSIQCTFPKPLRVGEEVELTFSEVTTNRLMIEARTAESVVTKVELEWKEVDRIGSTEVGQDIPENCEPRVLTDDEIERASGSLSVRLNPPAAAALFPNLVGLVSPLQIAVLLATTRLVGMECPGLRSVFSALNLVADGSGEQMRMMYKATKLDRRFGLVLIDVAAGGMAGVIKAFVRPTPIEQANYFKIKPLVKADEFAGQRAIVIGASRGLGEVTAKLLAAGGANVTVTYHQGALEARHLVEEIVSNGGRADCVQFDVLSKELFPLQASAEGQPTHLYYFATPFIFAGSRGSFSMPLFHKFCDYYVAGFLNTMNSLKGSGIRRVFNPSSIAVEELPPDMGEYAAAKTATETLCQCLEKQTKGLKIYQPRLPRMGTDQTVSLLPVDNKDPVPIMLSHIRAFRDL